MRIQTDHPDYGITLVSTTNYYPGQHMCNLWGEIGFKRTKYSIEYDLTLLMFVCSSVLLLFSLAALSVTILGTGCVFMIGGVFRPKIHIDDPMFRFANHSFSPNVCIKGRSVKCIRKISPGDPIVFNYYTTESRIRSAFKDSETGDTVK